MKTPGTKNDIRGAVWVLLNEKNIEKITVKEICSVLSINRSTFYRYYDSVYSVLQEFEDEFFRRLDRANTIFTSFPLDDKYFTEVHPGIIAVLNALTEDIYLARQLFVKHRDEAFVDQYKKVIRKTFFEKAVREKYISVSNEQKALIAEGMVEGHAAMFSYWVRHYGQIDLQEMALIVYRSAYAAYRCDFK